MAESMSPFVCSSYTPFSRSSEGDGGAVELVCAKTVAATAAMVPNTINKLVYVLMSLTFADPCYHFVTRMSVVCPETRSRSLAHRRQHGPIVRFPLHFSNSQLLVLQGWPTT